MVYRVTIKIGCYLAELYFTDLHEAADYMATTAEHLDNATDDGKVTSIFMEPLEIVEDMKKGLNDVEM